MSKNFSYLTLNFDFIKAYRDRDIKSESDNMVKPRFNSIYSDI